MDLTLFSRSYSASSRGTLNQVNQNLRSRTVTNKMASGKARKPLTPSAKIPALPAEEKQSIIDGGVQFQIKLRRAMQSRDRKIRSNQTEDLGCSNDEWTSDGDGYTTGSYSSNIARNSRQHGIYLQSKMNAARKAVEVENDCKSYSETYGIGNRNIPLRNSEREKLALEKFEERKVDSPLSQHFFSVEKESNSSHVPMQNSMEIPETPDRKERTKLHIDLSRSLTASSTGRRKSQMQSLIPHWSGQSQDSNDAVQNAEISQNFNTPTPYLHQHVGGHEKLYHSNLLELTGSLKMRRKSFGIVSKSDIGHSEEQTNANGRGYHSEGDFSYISQKSRSVRGESDKYSPFLWFQFHVMGYYFNICKLR